MVDDTRGRPTGLRSGDAADAERLDRSLIERVGRRNCKGLSKKRPRHRSQQDANDAPNRAGQTKNDPALFPARRTELVTRTGR